jgi:hypothetical protein
MIPPERGLHALFELAAMEQRRKTMKQVERKPAGSPCRWQTRETVQSWHPGISSQWTQSMPALLRRNARRLAILLLVLPLRPDTVEAQEQYSARQGGDTTVTAQQGCAAGSEQAPHLLTYSRDQTRGSAPASAIMAPAYRHAGTVCTLLATLLLVYRVWTVQGPARQTLR